MRFLIANLLLIALPLTRWFGLKRRLLNMLGVHVEDGACICGYVQFHGAGRVSIGRSAWIGPNTHFYTAVGGDVRIGANCDVAPDVIFAAGSHLIGDSGRRAGKNTAASITVGAGTWIGVRTTILPGASIGQGSVIAAGSVVKSEDFEPSSLLGGVPARFIRQLPQ